MEHLRSLIKEVLSQPKKKDCNCGCNDCEGKAPILTEGKVKHLISEGLQYHIDKKIQLHESVYRIGSEKHFELIREARALWVRGIIDVSEDDQAILETHLGHFGMYEGEEVPLDMPMVNEDEATFEYNKARAGRIMKDLFGLDFEFDYTYKPEGDKIVIDAEGYNPDGTLFDMKDVHKEKIIRTFQDKIPNADAKPNMGGGITVSLRGSSLNEEKEYYVTYNKGRGQGKGLVKSEESNYEKPKVFSKEEAEEYVKRAESRVGQMTAYWVSDIDMNRLEEDYDPDEKQRRDEDEIFMPVDDEGRPLGESLEERIDRILEARKKKKKKKKKDPPLNKPKRGGSKAYYVYVRDPKTKKIKKVSFGSGGLKAKIRNADARKRFAARHNCKNKKDRTTAGYWSCNLPRYAEQLGLGSKMNTFW